MTLNPSSSSSTTTTTGPSATSTGFTFTKGKLPQPELKNRWDEALLARFTARQMTPEVAKEFYSKPVNEIRAVCQVGADYLISQGDGPEWGQKVTPKRLVIDTTSFPPSNNPELEVFELRPPAQSSSSNSAGKALPAFVYAHGGGGVFLTPQTYHHICARHCVENNVVVFNVNYRLAPEHPFPAAPYDIAGVVQYLHANASALNIDPERIVVAGDSGGGLIAAATSYELVKRGKSNLVKLCLPIHPMSSDAFTREANPLVGEAVEGGPEGAKILWGWNFSQLTPPAPVPASFDWALLYPNRISKEAAAQFPPTAILTGEMDYCRRMAEELGAVLSADGVDRLVEFIVEPAVTHVVQFDFSHPLTTTEYFSDVKKILELYL